VRQSNSIWRVGISECRDGLGLQYLDFATDKGMRTDVGQTWRRRGDHATRCRRWIDVGLIDERDANAKPTRFFVMKGPSQEPII
jgi:hypothetical protein